MPTRFSFCGAKVVIIFGISAKRTKYSTFINNRSAPDSNGLHQSTRAPPASNRQKERRNEDVRLELFNRLRTPAVIM